MEKFFSEFAPKYYWQLLIEEACSERSICLSDSLTSYLVLLLGKFSTEIDLTDKVLAVEYLNNTSKNRAEKINNLKDIGDRCLLISGFFPHSARSRSLKFGYFVDLGILSYSELCAYKNEQRTLYMELGQQFVSLMDILLTIRNCQYSGEHIDMMLAQEIYDETGSKLALDILCKRFSSTNKIYIPPTPTKH